MGMKTIDAFIENQSVRNKQLRSAYLVPKKGKGLVVKATQNWQLDQ